MFYLQNISLFPLDLKTENVTLLSRSEDSCYEERN